MQQPMIWRTWVDAARSAEAEADKQKQASKARKAKVGL